MTARARAVPKLGYQPSLDGLRALSVVAVMLYHAGFGWMQGGFLGVEVFFVVSGFLITTLLVEERHHSGAVDLRQFWVRRGRRLLPALYLLLAVVVTASLLVYRDAAGRLGGDVLAALFYVYNWWLIFLDQAYFEAAGRPPLLQHLWSLAVEEQFYLVFPPLFILGLSRLGKLKMRWVLLGVGAASAVLMAVLYGWVGKDFVYFATFTRLSGILLGCFLALVWTPWQARNRAAQSAGPVLDIVGVVAIVAIGWCMVTMNGFDSFVFRGGFVVLDVLTVTLIAVLVHPAARLSGLLAAPALVWIGVRSYSLYLWHWPIFQVTRPHLDVPGWLDGFALFVFRMALTFVAAELSYRYVETPLRKGALGRWWEGARSVNPARRAFFIRRGLTVGATFLLLVLVLGFGLYRAATDPSRADTEAAMIAEATGGAVAGAVEGDDPSTPVIDVDETPSSTVSSTSSVPAVSIAPGVTPTDAVAVGDSVLLGAQSQIETAMPGIRVDGKVARQFDSLLAVARWYIDEGYVPGTLIVHAGTNGTFEDKDLEKLIEAAGDRKVLLVNAKVERGWKDLVNGRMAAAAERHDNVVLVDWASLGGENPQWFTNDGSHLNSDGARAFAELIRTHL